MTKDRSADYRGWSITYSASGYTTAPMVGSWDFGGIDVDLYEIDTDMDFVAAEDALRHAQGQIDRWWDDRDAEALVATKVVGMVDRSGTFEAMLDGPVGDQERLRALMARKPPWSK
ncbi:hypothetical protein ACIU1J_32275 [Azospirillum doebereinerae]|uniref:hypothetical protein n=1 Tax=Azospirillum doebereinerae TaxID=92933 RepID=UPI001EE5717B|nr:hypothetical protein [Azospirillum doebereinerae]MCG5238381.1 hypothetical protein [Azospirillum doebereinerae]